MVWVFIDDNDDEFKDYQREFRKLEIEVTKEKLKNEELEVAGEIENFNKLLKRAEQEYQNKSEQIDNINDELGELRAGFYKVNLVYADQKAKLDVLKFELESSNLSEEIDSEPIRKKYKRKNKAFNEIKLEKEQFEINISNLEKQIKDLKSSTKLARDERDKFLKKVNLEKNKLSLLDRSEMSFMNKIGDIVRDLPILDFMDPYYKVKQTVVKDVLYDVNLLPCQLLIDVLAVTWE